MKGKTKENLRKKSNLKVAGAAFGALAGAAIVAAVVTTQINNPSSKAQERPIDNNLRANANAISVAVTSPLTSTIKLSGTTRVNENSGIGLVITSSNGSGGTLDLTNGWTTFANSFPGSTPAGAFAPVFRVDDGKLNANYWMTSDNFAKWLHGDFAATTMFVFNATTNNYASVSGTKPDWNKINMTTFRVRIAAVNNNFIASDTTAYTVDTTNLKKWLDVTATQEALKTLSIKGAFFNISNKAITDIVNTFPTAYLTPNIEILMSNNSKFTNTPLVNDYEVAINAFPKRIGYTKDLWFEIRATANSNVIVSRDQGPSNWKVGEVWDKATADQIIFHADVPPRETIKEIMRKGFPFLTSVSYAFYYNTFGRMVYAGPDTTASSFVNFSDPINLGPTLQLGIGIDNSASNVRYKNYDSSTVPGALYPSNRVFSSQLWKKLYDDTAYAYSSANQKFSEFSVTGGGTLLYSTSLTASHSANGANGQWDLGPGDFGHSLKWPTIVTGPSYDYSWGTDSLFGSVVYFTSGTNRIEPTGTVPRVPFSEINAFNYTDISDFEGADVAKISLVNTAYETTSTAVRVNGLTSQSMLTFDARFSPAALKARGLMMQYFLKNYDPSGNLTITPRSIDPDDIAIVPRVDYAGDSAKGFPAAKAGTYMFINLDDLLKGNAPLSEVNAKRISMRLVPYFKYVSPGNVSRITTDVQTSDLNANALLAQEEARVKMLVKPKGELNRALSDLKLVKNDTGHYNFFVSYQAALTRTAVKVDRAWLSNNLTLSGTTRNLTIAGLTQDQILQFVKNANSTVWSPNGEPGPSVDPNYNGWDKIIEPVFNVNDGSIPLKYYFRRPAFTSWLSGTYDDSSLVDVWNSETNEFETLPVEYNRPNWNGIVMTSFTARFAPLVAKYLVTPSIVNNPLTVTLTTTDITKWADLTKFLSTLKDLTLTGNTRSPQFSTLPTGSAAFNSIKTQLNNAFGTNAFQIESTPIFVTDPSDSTKRIPSFTTGLVANKHDLGIDALPVGGINYAFELGFRIVRGTGTAKVFPSTNAEPTEQAGPVIWNSANGGTELVRYVDITQADINNFVFSGNTRDLTLLNRLGTTNFVGTALTNIDRDSAIYVNEWGQVPVDENGKYLRNGAYPVADVYTRINAKATNIPLISMRTFLFREWLAGHLRISGTDIYVDGYAKPLSELFNVPGTNLLQVFGLRDTNINGPTFDGSWGRNSFVFDVVPWNRSNTIIRGASLVGENVSFNIVNPVPDFTKRDEILYSARDITDWVKYFKQASTPGASDGVSLWGNLGVTNGILATLPDAFYNLYTGAQQINRALQLQYTTSGKVLPNGNLTANDAPFWQNAALLNYPANEIAGSPAGIGFKLTLNPVNGSTLPFLAFRLVPRQNDLGANTNPIPDPNELFLDTLNAYYDGALTRLFVRANGSAARNAQFIPQSNFYYIGAGSIATPIDVSTADLSTIVASGNTRDIVITNSAALITAVANKSSNAALGTSTVTANLRILYTIDLKDGTFINGNSTNVNALWLTEEDFKAYLGGFLVVSSGRVVYRSNQTKIVEAFDAAAIASRNWKDGDPATPNYLTINTISLTTPSRNSIFAKWSTISADYEANDSYVTSDSDPKPLSYTIATLKKYLSGAYFNDQISKVIVNGNTSVWDLDFNAAPDLQATSLAAVGLKFQYSLDGATDWSDTKIDFTATTITYAQKAARSFFIRVVDANYTGTTAITNQALTNATNLYIDYLNVTAGSKPNLTDVFLGGERKFKVYLNVGTAALEGLKAFGNSYALDTSKSDNLKEDDVDTNLNEFTALEIQYLFNNQWFNRAGLLVEMQNVRDGLTDAAKAATYLPPVDFSHTTLRARWSVIDPKNYVILNQITTAATASTPLKANTSSVEVNKTEFKSFINIWALQDKTTNKVYSAITNGLLTGEAALFKVYGSSAAFDGQLLISQIPSLATFLTQSKVKIQYSNKAAPSDDLISADWTDAATGQPNNVIFSGVVLNANKDFYVRFVPETAEQATSVASSYKGNGLQTKINPIKLDTSELKASITTSADALKDLVVSGNTQAKFAAAETPYLKASLTNGKWGFKGVTLAFDTEAEANTYVTNAGLRIEYRVTATRTRGAYAKDTVYVFNNLKALKDALDTQNLNFNRATLEVRWGVSGTSATVTNSDWVKPNVTALINAVYTEDVFTFSVTTYSVTGNNKKLNPIVPSTYVDQALGFSAIFALTATRLNSFGVKVQFNITNLNGLPDATKWLDSAPTGGLNNSKDIWIRYQALPNYEIVTARSGDNAAQQVTRMQVSNLRVAIPFDLQATTQAVTDAINAAELAGTTYDFNWRVDGARTYSIPAFQTNETDPLKKLGKVQYSIDGKVWSDTVAGALSTSDHYGFNVLMLDKDRGDKLNIRYVYSATSAAEVNPEESKEYVFTDNVGNEIPVANLKRAISINTLVQPVFTTATIGRLTGQATVLVGGGNSVSPNGTSDFANTTWQDFANSDRFLPRFTPAATAGRQAYQWFEYDSLLRETSGQFIANLGKNPFSIEVLSRTPSNALAPRNTYFEYRYRAKATDPWTEWSQTLPNDLVPSSSSSNFEARLVAAQGYSLAAFTTTNKFALDNSSRTTSDIATQEWSRSFPVAILVSTKNVTVLDTEAAQATYIGFHDDTNPTGTFKTNDPQGNHKQDIASATIKDILVHIYDGGTEMDFRNRDVYYVLEWNVQNGNGTNLDWTDTRGTTGVGFHLSTASVTQAPGEDIPWYGYYPTSLRNGDVIQVRLRARESYLIVGDDKSTDYNEATRRSRWSHDVTFVPITTLTKKIDLASGFAIYNRNNLVDFYGQTYSNVESMPSITFQGNGGSGTVTITDPELVSKYGFEVAVLHPLGGEIDPDTYAPLIGYTNDTFEQQQLPNRRSLHLYDTPNADKSIDGGWIDNWQSSLRWLKPDAISSLSSGDALVVRLVAKPGYGFEWENTTNNFDDIVYPKDVPSTVYGSPLPTVVPAGKVDLKMFTNKGIAPVPVSGLVVQPVVDLSRLALVYSPIPSERINGINNAVTLNFMHTPKDAWRWEYRVIAGGTATPPATWTRLDKNFPSTLRNNDVIEIRAIATGSSKLPVTYNNTPVRLQVTELLDILNASGISRPVITFDGYEGFGTIKSIAPESGAAAQWSAALPSYPLGRPLLTSEGAVPTALIWEYQVTSLNPETTSATILDALPWLSELPADLRLNQFVRMRVGTVDKKKAALVNNEFVYSQNPSDTGNVLKNFTKLSTIKLNPANLDFEFIYSGRVGSPKVSYRSLIDSLDAQAVVVEWEISTNPGVWVASDAVASDITAAFALLKNGDSVKWRLRANPGYVFLQNDPNLRAGETVTLVTAPDGRVTYYLQKPTWTRKIDSLTILIITTNVQLGQMSIVAAPDNPLTDGRILDTHAMLVPITVENKESIVDANFLNTVDAAGNLYSSKVRVKYRWQAVDPFTGALGPVIEVDEPKVPSGLSNGDRIIAELYSIEPTYELSDKKSFEYIVTGLVTNVSDKVANPQLNFSGVSGAGTVIPTQFAPNRTRWIYSVIKKGALERDDEGRPILPIIDDNYRKDSTLPAPTKWSLTTPQDLSNGDYILAMLASSVPGASGLDIFNSTTQDKQTPISAWTEVYNLTTRVVDVSAYQFFNLYDPLNPYAPNANISVTDRVNYAFKLFGKQENSAQLQINSSLYSPDPSDTSVLVDNYGNRLSEDVAPYVQWGFAVSELPDADAVGLNFTPTLPTGLRNGQYVYVKLIAKTGQEVKLVGDTAQVFQITGLESPSSVPSKITTLVAVIVAGVVAIAVAIGIAVFIRFRGRKLHFKDR